MYLSPSFFKPTLILALFLVQTLSNFCFAKNEKIYTLSHSSSRYKPFSSERTFEREKADVFRKLSMKTLIKVFVKWSKVLISEQWVSLVVDGNFLAKVDLSICLVGAGRRRRV